MILIIKHVAEDQKKKVGRIDQLHLGLGMEVESRRKTAQKKVKLLCTILIHDIIYLSKLTEYILRQNLKMDYRLWVKVMCQCLL